MVKIAIVTNDGESISQHFGRSRYYKIYSIKNNKIVGHELQERTVGHFARQQPEPVHEPHQDQSGRHGYGAEASSRHAAMATEISDCNVLIAGGMGMGAYESFQAAGLEVIMTDKVNADEAVMAYLAGNLKNLVQERTD